jgi:hypothetical protein
MQEKGNKTPPFGYQGTTGMGQAPSKYRSSPGLLATSLCKTPAIICSVISDAALPRKALAELQENPGIPD